MIPTANRIEPSSLCLREITKNFESAGNKRAIARIKKSTWAVARPGPVLNLENLHEDHDCIGRRVFRWRRLSRV
jgi:hypothetical protein